jgi:Mn2+/Fe2+ NRAMP family transporter
LIFHWILGTVVGWLLLYNYSPYLGKFKRVTLRDDFGYTAVAVGLLFLFSVLFYNVDFKLPENGYPYGLAETGFMVVVFLSFTPFVVYRLKKLVNGERYLNNAYVKLWAWIVWIFIFSFSIAFIPNLNSYMKGLIVNLFTLPFIPLLFKVQ